MEFQRQERLLEEAKRELAICKKALSDAECAKHDLEERFEQEKQALNDEIYQLRECGVRGLEEGFEQRKQAPSLEDAVPQLKVRYFSPPSLVPNARVFQPPPLQTGSLCDDTVMLTVLPSCFLFRKS